LLTFTARDGQGGEATATITLTVERRPLTVLSVSDSPDPFSPSAGQTTAIRFALSEPATVSLAIYNSAGLRVGTPLSSRWMAGASYAIPWDGKDGSKPTRLPLPPGVYTYKLWSIDAAGQRHVAPYPAIGTVSIVP
jgi:hypothetical protein